MCHCIKAKSAVLDYDPPAINELLSTVHWMHKSLYDYNALQILLSEHALHTQRYQRRLKSINRITDMSINHYFNHTVNVGDAEGT